MKTLNIVKKIKFFLEAGVGGAGFGLATLGGLSFLPAVSFTVSFVYVAVTFCALSLATFSLFKTL